MYYETTKQLLLEASNSYYNKSISILTDEEFDDLKDKFELEYPTDPILHTIGASIKQSPFKKATHKIAMQSLNKVKTFDELKNWDEKCNPRKTLTYIVSEKLDGISIGLEYENGNLVKAITRGDGLIGEDITVNVRKMKNVCEKLKNFTGALRGEIILKQKDFEEINKICETRYEEPFKNLRNGASGIAKNRHGKYCEYLTIVYFDCTGELDKFKKFDFIENTLQLQTCFVKHNLRIDQCFKLSQEYEKVFRAELDYEIDGLVIEVNSIKAYAELGQLNKRPKAAIAIKFASLQKTTKILDVTWQLGTQGQITPVAKLEAVQLGGVTVRRASLHNLENFRKLELRYNDSVIVSRRNDVIPYVEGKASTQSMTMPLGFGNDAPGDIIPVLETCPSCNEKTEEEYNPTTEKYTFLICPNTKCPGKALGDLKKWIVKIGVKGKGVGNSTIEKLFDVGLLKTPADFYRLQKNDIARLEGFGIRSAEKLLDALHSKMELTLPEFIGGLNIKNFSSSMAEVLMENGYETLDQFMDLKFTTLIAMNKIEGITANAFICGIASKIELTEDLLSVGIKIVTPEPESNIEVSSDAVFTGRSFCFTGKIERINEADGKRYTRSLLEGLVLKNGGTVGKVKKGLTYLVQADPSSTSNKTQKAEKLDIQILGEAEFFTQLGM